MKSKVPSVPFSNSFYGCLQPTTEELKGDPSAQTRASAYRLAVLPWNSTLLAAPGCHPWEAPPAARKGLARSSAWSTGLWAAVQRRGGISCLFCLPRAAELQEEPTESSVQPRPRSVSLHFSSFFQKSYPIHLLHATFHSEPVSRTWPCRTSREEV